MSEVHGPELDPAAEYSHNVIDWITRSTPVGMLSYGHISLSNDGVGLEIPSAPNDDPTMTVKTTNAILYWGRAGHPLAKHRIYEARHIGQRDANISPDQEAQELHRLILGAYIGPLALEQVPRQYREAAKDFSRASRIDAGVLWSQICAKVRAPVALVQTGVVTRSAHLRPNARVASLWHPALMQPSIALRELQEIVRRSENRGRAQRKRL